MIDDPLAYTDIILGHIPRHIIRGQAQWTVIGRPNPFKDTWGRVHPGPEMVGDCHPRLEVTHDLAEGFRRSVDLRADLKRGYLGCQPIVVPGSCY